MSLNILHAHVNEMVHDLVKELWAGRNKGGGELDLGEKAGCYESSAQETSQRKAGRSESKNWKIPPFKCRRCQGKEARTTAGPGSPECAQITSPLGQNGEVAVGISSDQCPRRSSCSSSERIA
jgi:hypothetical protein